MECKLAEALLRRKQLEGKVKQLEQIKKDVLVEVKAGRVKAHEGLDDFVLQVPKVSVAQVTKEYDFYSQQLRFCDAMIQQLNWTVQVPDAEKFMNDWDPDKVVGK